MQIGYNWTTSLYACMPKLSTNFVCQQCGWESPKWLGQCPGCRGWNTMVETSVSPALARGKASRAAKAGDVKLTRLSNVDRAVYGQRISTGIGELDRVLGGGIVPGMVTLIAGEPGIGKSTLLLQIADKAGSKAANGNDARYVERSTSNDTKIETDTRSDVIYVAGEESASQVASRANRLGIKGDRISILEETDVDSIIGLISQIRPIGLIIVDSIQTMTTSDLTGTAGSVGQVRETASRLTAWAKRNHVPLFMVGHVTKEGTIAGPRVLEHAVDTVLWFEGERNEFLRVIRAVKNRFGPTDEVGVFTMEEKGLVEVVNPASLFIGETTHISGSAVGVILEGTRPMLVEVQALVSPTKLAFPKRSASGIDARRLELILAVLSRRVGLPLWDWDVFVNVTGGIRVVDPASDLAVALAVASAFIDKPLPGGSCVIGEVGLLGEVRDVLQRERRIKEAKRLGYNRPITNKEIKTVSEAVRRFVSSK